MLPVAFISHSVIEQWQQAETARGVSEGFSGDNNSFHQCRFVRSSFSCPEKLDKGWNEEGQAEQKGGPLINKVS